MTIEDARNYISHILVDDECVRCEIQAVRTLENDSDQWVVDYTSPDMGGHPHELSQLEFTELVDTALAIDPTEEKYHTLVQKIYQDVEVNHNEDDLPF